MLYLQWPPDGTDSLSPPSRGGLCQACEETPGDRADVFNQLRTMGWGWGALQNSHFLRESCVCLGGGASKPSAQQISEIVSLSPGFLFSQGEREGREEKSTVSWLN